jgi:uncharacterized membrane protein YphA (DoxX/SURF4 family)
MVLSEVETRPNDAEKPIAETPSEPAKRAFQNSIPDWLLRTLIALVFVFFGSKKFSSGPDAPWVKFFAEVGFGQWLRYFTGVLEVLGGILVLAPQTVAAGLVLLGCVMVGAILVLLLVLQRPGDAFVAFAFLCALTAFWLRRRRS